jgi:hypothetical protein
MFSGCSPYSDEGQALQQMYGQLRIEPAINNTEYDYVVSFPAMIDFGFNTRRAEDRRRYVSSVLDSQCNSTRIVDEIETVTGKFLNGNDRVLYTVMVKCEN